MPDISPESQEVIRLFLAEFWRERCWQINQSFAGAEVTPRYVTPDQLYDNLLGLTLHDIALASERKMPDDRRGEVREACQQLAEWLFSIPGAYVYHIPRQFYETPIGSLWAGAMIWVQGDELITIATAARIAGVTEAAIGQRINRGTLTAYINPASSKRQGRRLVSRADVEAIKAFGAPAKG